MKWMMKAVINNRGGFLQEPTNDKDRIKDAYCMAIVMKGLGPRIIDIQCTAKMNKNMTQLEAQLEVERRWSQGVFRAVAGPLKLKGWVGVGCTAGFSTTLYGRGRTYEGAFASADRKDRKLLKKPR